jgi:TIR domain
MPKRVLFSYSPKDEALREELEEHLASLRAKGDLETWHARKILAGDETRAERELEAADIVLLLVSASFLASEYCREEEVRRALERHARGKVRVVPVVLRPCLWQEEAFGRLASLPANGQPITSWSSRDEAWLDVARGVRDLIRGEGTSKQGDATEVRATGPTRPEPARPEVERWLRGLEAAQAKKEKLAERGEDTAAVQAEIADRKRRLREGGQLQQNDSLGDGRYFLLRQLGRGGFATVWEADDRTTGKRVCPRLRPESRRGARR